MKYQLVLKEIETGEVVVDEEIDAIVAGIAKKVGESRIACRSFSLTSGIVLNSMNACFAAQRAVEDTKQRIVDHCREDTGMNVSFADLTRAAESASTSIEIDSEALKAIMEQDSNEGEC